LFVIILDLFVLMEKDVLSHHDIFISKLFLIGGTQTRE
jgi:hypothetical protein